MQVEVYLGERRILPSEMTQYRCVNEYVGDVINELSQRMHEESVRR